MGKVDSDNHGFADTVLYLEDVNGRPAAADLTALIRSLRAGIARSSNRVFIRINRADRHVG